MIGILGNGRGRVQSGRKFPQPVLYISVQNSRIPSSEKGVFHERGGGFVFAEPGISPEGRGQGHVGTCVRTTHDDGFDEDEGGEEARMEVGEVGSS